MNKKIIIGALVVLLLNSGNTGLAASANLFKVVPQNDWTYSALNQLAQAGIVDAFGGGAYKSDTILTRCEMAAIVAKAIARENKVDVEGQAIIAKLKAEFAPELNMADAGDVSDRVKKLEKNVSPIKIASGDIRIRYQTNYDQKAKNTDSTPDARIQERIRLSINADINDQWSFKSRLWTQNTSNKRATNAANETSSTLNMPFDQAEIIWKNKQATFEIGRILPSIGQGIIWDGNSIDAAFATYDFGTVKFSFGYGDLNAYTMSGATTNAALANVIIKAGDKTNFTIGYLGTMTNSVDYNFKQTAYGFSTKEGDFTLTGEYVRNDHSKLPANAQKSGYWARLKWKGINNSVPGSFGINLDYLSFGNYSIDSTNNPGTLLVSGGNGIGGAGAKGYGFGVQYVLAKNVNIEADYYNLRPYDTNQAGFNGYKPSYHLITNYKF